MYQGFFSLCMVFDLLSSIGKYTFFFSRRAAPPAQPKREFGAMKLENILAW
jgi:hypothetical protein